MYGSGRRRNGYDEDVYPQITFGLLERKGRCNAVRPAMQEKLKDRSEKANNVQ